MRRALPALFMALVIPCHADDAGTGIQVHDMGSGWYHLTLVSSTITDPIEGQRALIPTAEKLCQGLYPKFGHYSYDSKQPADASSKAKPSLTLEQDLELHFIAGLAERGAEFAPAWQPTPGEEQAVEKASYDYFASKDSGDYLASYDDMDRTTRGSIPFKDWMAMSHQFNEAAGPVVSRKIVKVSWYKDPPAAPPGVYAAADYVSRFKNVDIHCGYLAWFQQPDGSFLLVREEENYITKDMEAKLTNAQISEVQSKFGCAGE